MAVIETKFGIGDVVYTSGTTTERRQHDCPDCLGSRKWLARSPAGAEIEFDCPRCGGGYQSNSKLSLSYSWHVPAVARRTIGQIKALAGVRSDWDRGHEYMCHETGIGSGSLYREEDLYATEEEARVAAQAKADAANADPQGWVAQQYEGSLKLSDYQLKDAQVEAADMARISAEVGLGMLLDDLRAAEDMTDIRQIIASHEEG